MADKCEWCKYNPYSPDCDSDGKCDFKNLAYNKDAIIERLRYENNAIKGFKERVIEGKFEGVPEEELGNLTDAIKGMQIMVNRLVTDFGMTEDEVRKESGFTADTFMNKMKIYTKLRKMQKSRGKKNGNRKST